MTGSCLQHTIESKRPPPILAGHAGEILPEIGLTAEQIRTLPGSSGHLMDSRPSAMHARRPKPHCVQGHGPQTGP